MSIGADFSVLIADASRLAAIRGGVSLPGRLLPFTSGNLAAAMESIRAYRPKLVALEAIFAQSPAGAAFAERIDEMRIGIAISVIVRQDGRWVTAPWQGSAAPPEPDGARIVVPQTSVIVPVASTRRAPRFKVRSPLEAMVEGARATLIDLSIHGAQVVSVPVLRPNQKIKVGLTDKDGMLDLVGQVAWSAFEQASAATEPYYRVGVEFSGAAQQKLDAYRLRNCSDQPIPAR